MIIAPKKHPFVIWWLSNFSHGSQTYYNNMESQCWIDTTNFINTKNHFNHFWSIFAFFSTNIFLPQIYFGITQYKLKKWFFLWFNFLWYNLPYYARIWKKYVLILPWLKFKHGHHCKIVQCDNIFGPPCSVVFTHIFLKSSLLEHARTISYSPQKDLSNSVLHALIIYHLSLALKGFIVDS